MSGTAFSCLNPLSINYKRVVISVLSLTASCVITRWAEEKPKERSGRCCYSIPYGCNGMSFWPHTHNDQYSWARAAGKFIQDILPQIENQKKELNKKKIKFKKYRRKEESASSCPSSLPGSSSYAAASSWPTGLRLGLCMGTEQHAVQTNQCTIWDACGPCCVPSRYINRSQVKPGCLLAHFLKIKLMCQALSTRSLAQGVYLVSESAKPDQWSGEKKQLLELYRLRKSPAKVDHRC